LIVSFAESTGGYPTPAYWYTIDGGQTYTDSGATGSPFVIGGLAAQQTYSVQIKAVSVAGETAVSNAVSGEPIVSGSSLTIYRIDSISGGMQVNFDRTTAGIPMNGTNYYYSLNGGNTFANSGQQNSPVTISGMTIPGTYQVVLRAINSRGRVALSNMFEGQPYIVRNAPVIRTVASLENGLEIDFDESTGGYPASTISYWYSLDGGATFVDSELTESPITVSGLSVAKDLPGRIRWWVDHMWYGMHRK
jgi:titin